VLVLTVSLINPDFLLSSLDENVLAIFRTVTSFPKPPAGLSRCSSASMERSKPGDPLFRLDSSTGSGAETARRADRRSRRRATVRNPDLAAEMASSSRRKAPTSSLDELEMKQSW